MNNEQPIKYLDAAVISAMTEAETVVPNELLKVINERISAFARRGGLGNRFRFIVVTQVAITSEISDALNRIYQAAGWKSMRFVGGRSFGVGGTDGYSCEFEVEVVER